MVYKLDDADKLCGVTYIDWSKHYSQIPTATCDMLETQCDKVIVDLDCGQEDNKEEKNPIIYKEYHFLEPESEETFKEDRALSTFFVSYEGYKKWVTSYNDGLYRLKNGKSQFEGLEIFKYTEVFNKGIVEKYGKYLLPQDYTKTYSEERSVNPDGSLLIVYTVNLPNIPEEELNA